MSTHAQVPAQYGDVRECVRAARGNLDKVKQLLARPSVQSGEESAAVLREIEVQLGCAVAILQSGGSAQPDLETRSLLQELQSEVAVLAQMFGEADLLFTAWLRAIQSKRAGYTGQGQAAPLVLVSKVSLEG
jgi:hypothetical protein